MKADFEVKQIILFKFSSHEIEQLVAGERLTDYRVQVSDDNEHPLYFEFQRELDEE